MSRKKSLVHSHPTRGTSLAMRRLLWLAIPLITGLLFAVAAHLLANRTATATGGCAPSTDHYLDGRHMAPGSAITYCSLGDRDRTSLATNWLPQGTRRIDIKTAGYGAQQEQTLSLQASDGQSIPIPLPALGEQWTPQTIIVPSTMRHQSIRLMLVDGSDKFRGWSGLGIVSYSSVRVDLQVMAKLVWILGLLQFMVAETALMLSRRLPKDQAIVATLLALGIASCVTVWTTYAFGRGGAFVGMAILIVLLAHAAASLQHGSESLAGNFHYFNKLLAPISSSVLLVFVLSLYPFPQDWDTWQYAADRWQSLPMDIWLPKYFADQLWAGHVAHPMIGSWLSSDRPPLQTGFYLMFKPLAKASGALYLIPAMWLQATCLVPMYFILREFRNRVNPASIIMLIVLSALFLYNVSFVWPKLVAGTFCAITYLALFSIADQPLGRIGKGIATGLGASLAMLSHGGAAFALFGIFATYLIDSHRGKWRIIAVAGITALLSYLPWMLYQKLADPPGTRLIAWQLAGVHDVSTHGVGWDLRHAYAQLTPAQWLQGRIANLAQIFNGSMTGFFTDFLGLFSEHSDKARLNILVHSFFHTFYAQWFFSPSVALCLLAIAWRRIGAVRAMLVKPFVVLASGLTFWTLVMFMPGSTIIHQGAYFLDLLGLMIMGVLTYAASARLFHLLLGLNAFVMVTVFVRADRITTSALPPLPINMQSHFWTPSLDYAYIAMVLAAMALNFLVIWQSYRPKEHAPPRAKSPALSCLNQRFQHE
ncbi:hypothetical protein [Rhodanobacter sp. C01]|uniref:hypothetical protein n=1 Tax=Rhodanobacter sp. C01 TaxID=1945856 RepID=UPI000984C7A2|nr:hypothetical protein [Rhodanobacter sp. C01]OOG51074.1 hypothetical protein B0E50_02555 [Rhodanobacter sp. C01]